MKLRRPPAAVDHATRQLAEQLRNEHLIWRGESFVVKGNIGLLHISPQPGAPIAFKLYPFSNDPRLLSALLEGLEDEDRFLPAHSFLSLHAASSLGGIRSDDQVKSDRLTVDFNGVLLEFPRFDWSKLASAPASELQACQSPEVKVDIMDANHRICKLAWRGEQVVISDMNQIPRIRAKWHRILDVTMGSVPYWGVEMVLFLPAAIWGAIWYRERRRAREGFCPKCGYDLRASSGTCPECGSEIRVNAVGKETAQS